MTISQLNQVYSTLTSNLSVVSNESSTVNISSTNLGDQLLMSDSSTSTDSTISDSLLQGLLASSQASSLPNVNSQNPQSNNTSNSVNLNSNWSTVLKQNPTMATLLVQSQIDQSLLSIFDQ